MEHRCLLVARKDNLTGISTGLTDRSKNLDPTGNPTGRSTRPANRPAGRPDRFPSLRCNMMVITASYYRRLSFRTCA